MKQKEIAPADLVAALRIYNLLPAIVFQPTRRRCDEAAGEVALSIKRSSGGENPRQTMRREIFEEFSEQFPEIQNHKHRNLIIRGGVAAHHAGHIPAWKLLIEKMMSKGLLDALFATTTVAAGVDFPARTVVLQQADTRGSDGWRPLRASELQQMTGRAGRRGKDKVGFVVAAPGQHQNPSRIAYLLKTKAEDLSSQFRATYTSLLNLLDAYQSFTRVREIAERSFAFRDTAGDIVRLEHRVGELKNALQKRLDTQPFGFSLENVRGFERLAGARARLQENLPSSRAELRYKWLQENVLQGRAVSQGRSGKRFFLVLNVRGDKVLAMRDGGEGTSFSLSRVNRVYAKRYPMKIESLEDALLDIETGRNPALDEPRLSNAGAFDAETNAVFEKAIDNLLPSNLDEKQQTEARFALWDSYENAQHLAQTENEIRVLREQVWKPFEQKAKVLDALGYINFAAQNVTESGKWLADLRIDRPLFIGEALKRGFMNDLSARQIAALTASLAADPDRNYGSLRLSDDLTEIFSYFDEIVSDVSRIEWKFGIEPQPELNYSAAATVALWANGAEWTETAARVSAEEGDLVRLFSRTGEALMQIAHLPNFAPEVAKRAAEAAEMILREPVR